MSQHRSPAWFEAVRSPLLLVNADLEVLDINGAAKAFVVSVPPLPCPSALLFGPAAEQALRALIGPAGQTQPRPPPVRAELSGQTLTLSPAPLPHSAGLWLITLERALEITAPWRAELETIINALPVGISVYDRQGNQLFDNHHSNSLFGYAETEYVELQAWLPIAYPDPAHRAWVEQTWRTARALSARTGEEILAGDWPVMCKDGNAKMVEFRLRVAGEHEIHVFWDVTPRRRLEDELRQMADTDNLTGLCNRRRFFDEARHLSQSAAVRQQPLSLLMLDLDHFKEINDSHGHATGDLMLQALANRCRQILRDQDLMARLGGEEFAVLLPDTAQADAERIAERLRLAVTSNAFETAGQRLDLRVSIGGATSRGELPSVTQLLERADRSLYSAKRAGRDCVRFEP